MIGAETRVTTNKDAAGAVDSGTRRALLDVAQKGFNVSQEHVPHGADSTLANSGFRPVETGDGSIVWGYRAAHARYVEEGTRPHWPPIQPLLKWARRVLGDEEAAYQVQWKIAQEGTPAQPYVERGIDAMKAKLRASGLTGYITEELGR